MRADPPGACDNYLDFLNFWKDADPYFPILRASFGGCCLSFRTTAIRFSTLWNAAPFPEGQTTARLAAFLNHRSQHERR